MFIQIKNAGELLQELRKIPEGTAAHGEASFGYSFELKDGSRLIIGQTDTDVSEEHLFWIQLINKPVETTKEQPKVSDFEKDLKVFIKVRRHDEEKNNPIFAYQNGALDAFNFLKSKLG